MGFEPMSAMKPACFPSKCTRPLCDASVLVSETAKPYFVKTSNLDNRQKLIHSPDHERNRAGSHLKKRLDGGHAGDAHT